MGKSISKAGLVIVIIGSALAAQGGNHVVLGLILAIVGTVMWIAGD